MDGALIRHHLNPTLLTTSSIIHPWGLANLTQPTLDLIFPAIPPASVRHRHIALIGSPESGKTVFLNWLAHRALSTYGRGNVNLIPVSSISKGIGRIDGRPVQLMIIDDAIKSANSRKAMSQADDIGDFYEVRHIYEAAASTKSGVVITIWAGQRFKSLDIVFRNAHAIIFKSSASDPADAKLIEEYIGTRYYSKLRAITSSIYMEANDDAKSESVVCHPFNNRAGIMRHTMTSSILDFKPPAPVSAAATFAWNPAPAVERMRQDRAWSKAAECYYLDKFQQLKPRARIAEKLHIDEGNISRNIQKVQGELNRLAGESYELWKASRLEADGWTVRRNGRTSMPDILADKDQQHLVISCKCLTWGKETTLTPAEIAPELHHALEHGTRLEIHAYNTATMQESIVCLDAQHIPPAILIR